jgi:hypothetical protein
MERKTKLFVGLFIGAMIVLGLFLLILFLPPAQ